AFALFAGALIAPSVRWSGVLAGLAASARPQMFLGLLAFVVVRRAILPFVATVVVCAIPILQNVGSRLSLYAAHIEVGHGAPIRDFLMQPWRAVTPIVLLMAIGGMIAMRRQGLALMAFTIANVAYTVTIGASDESVRPYVPSLIGVTFFAVALSSFAWRSLRSRS
ncbi:MAG: hypothetical protein JO093_23380, partial [Acidobacteria bacterium]|nr:hypothetical protein [Acidobacteriota bacterium]